MQDYLPHATCYLWDARLILWSVVADGLIAAAYFTIPVGLFIGAGVRRARGLYALPWYLFAAFVAACGVTHVAGIVVLWWPLYWLKVAVNLATAAISWVAAVLTFPTGRYLARFYAADQSEQASRTRIQRIADLQDQLGAGDEPDD